MSKSTIHVIAALAILSTAIGCGGESTKEKAPVILSFEAFPLEKGDGEYRLLSWETSYANRIDIYEAVDLTPLDPADAAFGDPDLVFQSDMLMSGVMEYRVQSGVRLTLQAFNTRRSHGPVQAWVDVGLEAPAGDHFRMFYPESSWVPYGENAVLNYTIANVPAGSELRVGVVILHDPGVPLVPDVVRSFPADTTYEAGQITEADCTPPACFLQVTEHKGFFAELALPDGTTEYLETYVGLFDVPLPLIVDFSVDEETIVAGGSAELSWEVRRANTVTVTGYTPQFCDAWLECRGTLEVTPSSTEEFTLTAEGPGGTLLARLTVTVLSTPVAPTVNSFTASPSTIHPRAATTLAWDTTLADSVGIVAVPADPTLPTTFTTDGSAVVRPVATTVYTLTATNTVGSANRPATVTVTPLAAGDLVVSEIMVNPAVVLDTDAEWFEIANPGTTAANLNTLTISVGTSTDTIDSDVDLAPGGYALLALSSTTTLNDNLPAPDFVYAGIALDSSTAGTLSIVDGSTTIDAVAWDGSGWVATEGYSWSLDPDFLTASGNDSFTNWCNGAAHWTGAVSNYGSPGAANPDC